jgi:cell division initiation protein
VEPNRPDAAPEVAHDAVRGLRLTPASVRRWSFSRAPLGRRGVPESEVELFRNRVAGALAHADADKADLRAEVDRLRTEVRRLHDYYRDHRVDPSRAADQVRPDPQAVNVISMAQQAADQHIAQAEQYARQLVSDARRQYEEILVTAHRQAEDAARAAALAELGAGGPAGPRTAGPSVDEQEQRLSAQLTAKITYLRTFAAVSQLQVDSILAALRRQVDAAAELSSGPGARAETHGSLDGPDEGLVDGPIRGSEIRSMQIRSTQIRSTRIRPGAHSFGERDPITADPASIDLP